MKLASASPVLWVKPMLEVRLPVTRVLVVSFVSCGALACNSSDFSTAPGGDDVGSDVSNSSDGSDGSGADATKLCVLPPAAVGTEKEFCDFEATLFSRCGQCETCRQTNLNACVTLGAALSPTFKAALFACKDVIACGDYTTYGNDPCVRAKLAAATPTAPQLAAKDDYCAKCTTNVAECKHFFDVGGGDAGADAGVGGIGLYVLISNDKLAADIKTACSGGLDCNPYVYELCSGGKLCNATAPDACKSGVCGK